ncbi:hypothetical protein GTZ99_14135 [Novosphingobium sp. FSY-8]|uniref:Uncharacterized protein n=1 Tax=Novosphingobium ovatum TaxID=1908523 RepID=A0ABW9XGK7_9SPHN|nr:hypothetical protein [Novosphingobium ovatum]NBC37690.1 hypothetical protein [Novosphingobium ovatum]
MIVARLSDGNAFASALTATARAFAQAQAQTTYLARQQSPLRWRSAGLLWPDMALRPPSKG